MPREQKLDLAEIPSDSSTSVSDKGREGEGKPAQGFHHCWLTSSSGAVESTAAAPFPSSEEREAGTVPGQTISGVLWVDSGRTLPAPNRRHGFLERFLQRESEICN